MFTKNKGDLIVVSIREPKILDHCLFVAEIIQFNFPQIIKITESGILSNIINSLKNPIFFVKTELTEIIQKSSRNGLQNYGKTHELLILSGLNSLGYPEQNNLLYCVATSRRYEDIEGLSSYRHPEPTKFS